NKTNGKGKAIIEDDDLAKPFKEVLKCPFTRRIIDFSSPSHMMPPNFKIYDETGDPDDHINRFSGIGNQEEWPMPVWCYSMPKTVNEMLRRLDDYIRSKEAFWDTKLPKGECQRREMVNNQGQWNDRIHKILYDNNCHMMDYTISHRVLDHCVPYVAPYRPPPDLHQNNNIPKDNKIIPTLESLISTLKEFLATTYQLRLPYIALPESMARMTDTQTTLSRFLGEQVKPLGKIELDVCFGIDGLCRKTTMKFTVIATPSPYNIIPGRNKPDQRGTRQSGISESISNNGGNSVTERFHQTQNTPQKKTRCLCMGTVRHDQHSKTHYPAHTKRQSFSHSGQPGKKNDLLEKSQVVTKKVVEWLKVGIVRPVRYLTWISNLVLNKKVEESWMMCIDFKNINSACPKEYYPLPEIDLKIELVMGFRYKCFLDAYKGYYQVQMAEEDEEKTDFYTDQDIFCYTKMSFDLKNVNATYQRLMDLAFEYQISQNLEAYIDDMVIKSKTKRKIMADVAETFDNLRRITKKLNLKNARSE
nr:hypothetical protein [Tanacetum cinerariifolium]